MLYEFLVLVGQDEGLRGEVIDAAKNILNNSIMDPVTFIFFISQHKLSFVLSTDVFGKWMCF